MMIIKDKIIDTFSQSITAIRMSIRLKGDVDVRIDGKRKMVRYGDENDMRDYIRNHIHFCETAQNAEPILFSADQADVFLKIIERYNDPLDFRLPFSNVFLQFSRPVKTQYQKRSDDDFDRGSLVALALAQTSHDRHQVNEWIRKDRIEGKTNGLVYPEGDDEVLINHMCFLYEDWGTEYFNWASGASAKLSSDDYARTQAVARWRNLAIACIGYINCENVYLEKQGEVPEAVNRKREAKGKSRLEPYYVCRIKGVQYEANGQVGGGNAHSIRYDVRGHFRRLQTDKTLWVRPHQRGLANELYIPKVYKVDKGSKPGFAA